MPERWTLKCPVLSALQNGTCLLEDRLEAETAVIFLSILRKHSQRCMQYVVLLNTTVKFSSKLSSSIT